MRLSLIGSVSVGVPGGGATPPQHGAEFCEKEDLLIVRSESCHRQQEDPATIVSVEEYLSAIVIFQL